MYYAGPSSSLSKNQPYFLEKISLPAFVELSDFKTHGNLPGSILHREQLSKVGASEAYSIASRWPLRKTTQVQPSR